MGPVYWILSFTDTQRYALCPQKAPKAKSETLLELPSPLNQLERSGDNMNMDLTLSALYTILFLFTLIGNDRRRKKTTLVICAGALVVFVLAEWGFLLGLEPRWFHAGLMFLCLGWAFAVLSCTNAIWCAAAIGSLAVFQVLLAIDGHLYPLIETAISQKRVVIATSIHFLILLAAHIHGRNILLIPRRRAVTGGNPR